MHVHKYVALFLFSAALLWGASPLVASATPSIISQNTSVLQPYTSRVTGNIVVNDPRFFVATGTISSIAFPAAVFRTALIGTETFQIKLVNYYFSQILDCKTPVKTMDEWGITHIPRDPYAPMVTFGPFTGTQCKINSAASSGPNSIMTWPFRDGMFEGTDYPGAMGNWPFYNFTVYGTDIPPPPPPDPCATPGACASNVLFLPGIEASRLYRPDGQGGEKKLWEPGGDADAIQLAMTASGSSARGDIYTRDVIDNAYLPIKGDVYKSFLEQLAAMKAGNTIADYTAVPYDWRLSFNDILTRGKQTGSTISYLDATSTPYIIQELKRLAATSKTKKVTIVAHSNGGLLAKALTDTLGAEASHLIDKLIFVSVPQAGTPQAIGAILHGYDQALPVKPLSLFGMTETAARELARNMPSVYNLLPSASYFTYVDDPVITVSADPLLAPWRAAYGDTIHSSERLRNFLVDESRAALPASDPLTAPIVGNRTLLDASEALHTMLDTWAPPAGIALTEIAGWGEETLKTIAYYQGTKSTCTAFKADSTCAAMISTPALQYSPKTVLDGDGTVVVPSALWAPSSTGVQKYWVDLKSYGEDNFFTNINRKHADILEIPQLRTFIQNIITNANTGPLPQFVSTSTPVNTDESGILLKFTLHSPLTLNLYDDLGNHTGFSTTTNSLEENIPGSRYLSFGEVQYISVPSSANLHLVMDGYADGSFTFDMEEVRGEAVIATTTFSGIPSFTDTKVMMDIPENAGIEGASDLRIDVQGDGTVDVELEPKLGGVVVLPMPLTVIAEDKTITLGDQLPSLTAHISDALDNAVADSDITGAPDCATTATATSPAGKYPITCSLGTLSSEKYEFTTFVPGTLTIQYRWDGFLQPIKDTAHQVGQSTSIFKSGSTVPVKFQLKNINGTPVQAATAPIWLAPQAGMSDGVYKWDNAAQQYVYNWSTKGLLAGYWYRIFAQLDDGNIYYATVGLK
ncbi:PxKF domain-containing protein [Candidatus Kaiserbacteria bacterium]|nr:PxKF domain-containing protein [Candidatus Kaiserbacteria bacterium]